MADWINKQCWTVNENGLGFDTNIYTRMAETHKITSGY